MADLGLFRRREVPWPTWKGWLVMMAAFLALLLIGSHWIYAFLAPVRPITGGDLVVEGWAPESVLEEVKAEFLRNSYRRLYVVGGPLGLSEKFCGYSNYADLGAAQLRALGLNSHQVQAVPAPGTSLNRTYASALALRDWQRAHDIKPVSYHLISAGPHARRSAQLFELALEKSVPVGVTAVPDDNYDPARWWASSAGFRNVTSEFIAWMLSYLVLLF